ncbi:hypothetical protein [Nocardiopsis alba]|uniref:hypothetical protein n=1 Tax=Nocardiopsis alba TaxID=53437 RepID=UPI0035DC11B6
MTTDRQPSNLPVPSTVSEVSWIWEAPEDSRVEWVLPTSHGAVVHLGDGAIGLDTGSGEELWRYRIDTSVADVALTPDGSRTVVSAYGWAAVLDTDTGEEEYVFRYNPEENPGWRDDELKIDTAGVVTDLGLVTTSGNGSSISLTPWNEEETGWTTEPSICATGSGEPKIHQGIATSERLTLIGSCTNSHHVLIGLDPKTGEELWRLDSSEEGIYEENYNYAVLDDMAVHQNIAPLRGTSVFDVNEGEIISDDLPDEMHNRLLRILPDGYLSVRTYEDDGETFLDYELRDFTDQVQKSITAQDQNLGSPINHFLSLDDSFLKLTLDEETEEPRIISVYDWGETGPTTQISLPVEMDIFSGLRNPGLVALELAVGPGRFESAPGAVLVREFPEKGYSQRIVGLS